MLPCPLPLWIPINQNDSLAQCWLFFSNIASYWQSSVTWASCRLTETQTCHPRPWHFQMPQMTPSFICKYCTSSRRLCIVTCFCCESSYTVERLALFMVGGKLFTHLIVALRVCFMQMSSRRNEQSAVCVIGMHLHISCECKQGWYKCFHLLFLNLIPYLIQKSLSNPFKMSLHP